MGNLIINDDQCKSDYIKHCVFFCVVNVFFRNATVFYIIYIYTYTYSLYIYIYIYYNLIDIHSL